MRTAWKVATALGVVALGVGVPAGFVVRGAGAAGRPDSQALWWERVRRIPWPVLQPPVRMSAVRAGGARVERVEAKARILETRKVPSRSPVVAIAELGDLVAVATFDDGVFVVQRDKTVQRVAGVAAVNALAFDGELNLCIASDDGAYLAPPGEPVRRIASGPFSAVAAVNGKVWFASRTGAWRLDGHGLTRWGEDHGLRAQQPTSIAACGGKVCLGAENGLWELGGATATRRSSDADRLPAEFVTALASGDLGTWAGTFDGGLVRLGSAPLTPADGLPEGRIAPRALAVVEDQAFAGTPSGLLVARGRTAALVPVGGEVSAVTASCFGGVWVGLPGRVVRVKVDRLPSSPDEATELSGAEACRAQVAVMPGAPAP